MYTQMCKIKIIFGQPIQYVYLSWTSRSHDMQFDYFETQPWLPDLNKYIYQNVGELIIALSISMSENCDCIYLCLLRLPKEHGVLYISQYGN